jgi:hypothetical protein
MALLSFQSCRDRIARAEAHSKAVADAWNDFIEEDPYSAVVRVEDNGTGRVFVEPAYNPFPSLFSLELGEFLYNIRAALDHAVYAAAIEESGRDPPPQARNLEFPIYDTPEHFKDNAWKIDPLTGNRRMIIESVQPYKIVQGLDPDLLLLSPHRTFGMLSDWARKDRHRRLHVLGSWASNASPMLRLPDGVTVRWLHVNGDGILENESEIARFRLKGWEAGMDIQANPNLAIDVVLDEVPPPAADNDTLGNRLRFMVIWVKQVVDAFEESILAERTGQPWPTHQFP